MSGPAPTRVLPRVTLSTQVAERIREEVLSGVHAPGAQLNELSLSQAYGVSRGPLREAMQRLVQEGLLRSEPHRGVFVPELSEEDLRDVYLVRRAIEGAAIRRVMESGDRADVRDALIAVSERMEAAIGKGDLAAAGMLDMEYHRVLVEAAGSPRLSRTYATVQAETQMCLRLLMGGYRRNEAVPAEHFRLAELIHTGTLDEALAELDRHLGDPVATLARHRSAARAGE